MALGTLHIGTFDIFIEVHKQHSSDGLVSVVVPFTIIDFVLACREKWYF